MPDNTIRGRFAPSPSGRLHLGNMLTFLLAWLDVRARGGTMVFRLEDLDPERSWEHFLRQPAFSAGFLLIVRLEKIRVDGVRDIGNRLSGEQSADFGLLRQPAATAYKRDGRLTINLFFLPEDSGG